MADLIEIWYHDESEVDPVRSWLANSAFLVSKAQLRAYTECSYSRVLALTEYARPDFILTVNGEPALSAELTKMNPSGHNLPQRFSCLVRAAELGIPSLYYYPEYSRRTVSDPNPRYLNVRVPLAQLRMSEIYGIPSLSLLWPTDPTTILPTSQLSAHLNLALFVEYVAKLKLSNTTLTLADPKVNVIIQEMKRLSVPRRSSDYPDNPSFRIAYPTGDPFTKTVLSTSLPGKSIDPPPSCKIELTEALLKRLYISFGKKLPKENKKVSTLLTRNRSFVYTGTANSQKTGPEHPFPGYLSMLDILYLRTSTGQTSRDRNMNLVFELPISLESYIQNAINRTTGLNILMEFADFIVLDNAVVLGGWIRNLSAGAVLIKR